MQRGGSSAGADARGCGCDGVCNTRRLVGGTKSLYGRRGNDKAVSGRGKTDTMVFEPVREVVGFTRMFAGVPGPVAVLQVTATDAVTVKVVAFMAPAPRVSASSATNALAPWLFNTDKSMEDRPCPKGFLHDIAGRRSLVRIATGHIDRSEELLEEFVGAVTKVNPIRPRKEDGSGQA